MGAKNKKKAHFMFNTYECTAVEKYLEDMADEGWELEKIKGYIFYFNKIEPSNIKYSVDLKPKISKNKEKNNEALIEYRDYCKAAGWDYICETNKLQIFSSMKNDNIVAINTDEHEKFRAVLKESIFELLGKLSLVLMFALNVYIRIFSGDSFLTFSSNFMIFSIFIFFDSLVYNLVEAVSILLWSIKARRSVKENKEMPFNSYDKLLKRNFTNKLLMYAILILPVFFVYASNNSVRPYILLGLSIFIVILCRDVIATNKSKGKIFLNATSTAAPYYLFLVAILFVLSAENLGFSDKPNAKIKALENAPISAQDFGYKNIKNIDYSIQYNKSIFAETIDYHYFGIADDYFGYKYLKSGIPGVIHFSKKQLFNFISKDKFDAKISLIKNSALAKIDDEIQVYRYGDSNNFALISKDKIISVFNYSNDRVDNDEFLLKVYDEVFNKN